MSLFKTKVKKQEEGEGMTLESIMAKLSEEEQEFLRAALLKQEDDEEETTKTEDELKAEDEEEEAMKRLPLSLRKKLEENEDLRKRLADVEKAERLRKFADVAKGLQHVPGQSTDELAETLEEAERTMSKAAYDRLLKSLQSTNEAVQKSALLKRYGSNEPEPGSAEEQVEALAKAIVEKDPAVPLYKARTIVYKNNPELYARIREGAH